VPSKADTESIYSYAVLRYLVDRQREITVPIGIVLWSADQGQLWFRLPHEEERIDGEPTVQSRAYGEIVRAKIEGWHQRGELPYQTEPLLPLSDAWWGAVGRLLQWRVRLGPVRVVTCCEPEVELERLYEVLVHPHSSAPDGTESKTPQEEQRAEALATET
jgi:Protein of unknown function (DUF3037)